MSDDEQSQNEQGMPGSEPQSAVPTPLETPLAGFTPPPPPPPPVPPRLPQNMVYPPPAPAAATPRRSPIAWILLALLALLVVTLGIGSYVASQFGGGMPGVLGGGKIGVITITGVIKDGGRGGLFAGPAGSRGIMQDIRKAAKDNDVKAVILLLNTPGGSPAASHAIWEEVMRLRGKKKVVACMTDICASGGYYIASAADTIVAQGSTLTGSIGVIFGGVGYYGLMQKLGLTDETQTAGKYKDMGSGMRPMTAEEKQYLHGLLQDVYSQFIEAVAKGRRMDPARVRKLAEGRIYTGNQAKQVGLVDSIGNFYDAVKVASKAAGINPEGASLKYYGQSSGLFGDLDATESLFKHIVGRSSLNELPLQGPMLVSPYTYQMIPAVSGLKWDEK